MPNGFIVINEKDWEKSSSEQRDWMLFHTLQLMDKRLNNLEHKHIDKVYAFIGGIVGGIVAWLTIKIT